MTEVTPPLENTRFSPFFDFTVLRPPGILHAAVLDEEGDVLTEPYEETVTVDVPVMGVVYRDATAEEQAAAQVPIPTEMQIQALKNELAAYDYIGVKLAMGVATREEYAEEIAHTETLRQRIRALESEVG